MSEPKLWFFNAYFGRMGNLDGLFIATQEEVDKLIGKNVYFGEVLGKHSEVYTNSFPLEWLAELPVKPETIQDLVAARGCGNLCGINPLDYLDEEEEEEE